MTKYFLFDTETTSLKEPCIIQFAYIICDDEGYTLEVYNKYWKSTLLISEASQNIHHISEDDLIDKGIDPINEIKQIIIKMKECQKIIAHNVEFDIKALIFTSKYYDIPIEKIDNTFCTMRRSKYFVGLYNDKGWVKWPKLIELYRFLGGNIDEELLHDALEDVKILKECYFLAKQKNFW